MYEFILAHWAFIVLDQPHFAGFHTIRFSIAINANILHSIHLSVHAFDFIRTSVLIIPKLLENDNQKICLSYRARAYSWSANNHGFSKIMAS